MKKLSDKKKVEDRLQSRRQFLIGLGGTTLLLPSLVSLMPKKVAAQVSRGQPKICLFPTEYGVWPKYLIPRQEDLGAIREHNHRLGNFQTSKLNEVSGSISRLIDSRFDSLRNKLNIFHGIDWTHNERSHTYGHWTGCAPHHPDDRGNRNPRHGKSIDRIIETYEPFKQTFAGAQATTRIAFHKTFGGSFSFDRDQPNSLPIQLRMTESERSIFDQLFGGSLDTGPTDRTGDRKKLIVDAVFPDWKNLKDNNRRISYEDKQMLDRFITGIEEVEKNLDSGVGTASCEKPSIDFDGSRDQQYRNTFDMLVLAFACDQTRMVNWWNKWRGDGWLLHHDGDYINNEGADEYIWFIQHIRRFAERLDEFPDPSGDGSLLDNSLLVWMNEHGARRGHRAGDLPLFTLGSLGGRVESGYYMDYNWGNGRGYPLTMFLCSILQAMGVPRSHYIQFGDSDGFGEFGGSYAREHYPQFLRDHNDPLPFFFKKA